MHKIVTTTYFENMIMAFILLNMVCLIIEYHGQTEVFVHTLEIINNVFVVIFLLEAAMKITGIGFANYFRDPSN